VAEIARKRTINHDEAISYLSATGHQGRFATANKPPVGSWVKASKWKSFTRLEKSFPFGQIGSDLAHYDIHPPLYFWLLHLWSLALGIRVWTGPSFNVFISLLTTLALFGLAHYVLNDSLEAALVAFIWALSPAVVSVSSDARQYDLLALITVLFAWQVIKCTDLRKQFLFGEFGGLLLLSAAGALTHYHFFLVALGSLAFLTARLIKKNAKRLIAALGSVGLGFVLFFLLHPQFYLSFSRQRVQAQPFAFEELTLRVRQVAEAFLFFFFGDIEFAKYVAAALMLAFLLWAFVAVRRHQRRLIPAVVNTSEFSILYFFLWIAGTTVFLYLAFLSPMHAMGARYLSMAWPFFAFVPVLLLRFLPKPGVTRTLVCLSMLLFAGVFVLNSGYVNNRNPDPSTLLRSSERIMVDNLARGVFPRIFWHVPDDKLILAAPQDFLLNRPDIWLHQLEGNGVYISDLSYGNSIEKQKKIIDLIKQVYEVTTVEGGVWGVGNAVTVLKKK
jgi:hypothetical protein